MTQKRPQTAPPATALLIALAILGGGTLSAQAQATPAAQDSAGSSSVFSFGLGLSAGRNLALDPAGNAASQALTGSFGYDLTRATASSKLTFGAKSDLVVQQGDDTETGDGLSHPVMALGYQFSGARSEVTAKANYQRADVSDLSIALDDQGLVAFYAGTGTRATHKLDLSLRGGVDMPLGYSLALSAGGTRYKDTILPLYYDSDTRSLQAQGTAQLSPKVKATSLLSYSVYDADTSAQTHRETTRARLGAEFAIDRLTTLDVSLGQSRIETKTTTDVTTTEGLDGAVSLTREDKRGSYTLAYERALTLNGTREMLTLQRAAEFATANLTGNLGVSRGESGDSTWIGALTATVERPRDQLSLDFARQVQNDDEGLDVTVTQARANLSHLMGTASKLDFGLMASQTEAQDTRSTRADLSLTYHRLVTRDVALTIGLVQQLAQETATQDASGQKLFITLSRDFEWRH